MKKIRKRIIAYLLAIFTTPKVKEAIARWVKSFVGEAVYFRDKRGSDRSQRSVFHSDKVPPEGEIIPGREKAVPASDH
jgi:hypothetical protein